MATSRIRTPRAPRAPRTKKTVAAPSAGAAQEVEIQLAAPKRKTRAKPKAAAKKPAKKPKSRKATPAKSAGGASTRRGVARGRAVTLPLPQNQVVKIYAQVVKKRAAAGRRRG